MEPGSFVGLVGHIAQPIYYATSCFPIVRSLIIDGLHCRNEVNCQDDSTPNSLTDKREQKTKQNITCSIHLRKKTRTLVMWPLPNPDPEPVRITSFSLSRVLQVTLCFLPPPLAETKLAAVANRSAVNRDA